MCKPCFLVDLMLGRLSKWLRILGYDTLYFRDTDSRAFLALAIREKDRLILTRNTALAQDTNLKKRILLIRNNDPTIQLIEVIEYCKLKVETNQVGTRCLICNLKLKLISPDRVQSKVPEYIASTQKHFSICPGCNKIFWRGTHFENMWEKIKKSFKVNH